MNFHGRFSVVCSFPNLLSHLTTENLPGFGCRGGIYVARQTYSQECSCVLFSPALHIDDYTVHHASGGMRCKYTITSKRQGQNVSYSIQI